MEGEGKNNDRGERVGGEKETKGEEEEESRKRNRSGE